MSSLRRAMKAAAEGVLGSKALATLRGGSDRRRTLILAYHNIVPGAGGHVGDRSLHIGFDLFRRHLDLLARRAAIVPLEQVVLGTAKAGSAAITFDDAYASAMALALPELVQREIPATIFIAPGLLGAGAPWWDVVATGTGGLDTESREYCLSELGGDTVPILEWSGMKSLRREADPACRIAALEELSLIRGSNLVTTAAHSWAHPNLTNAGPERLKAELSRPLRWLSEHFPSEHRPWLAYPYGLHSAELLGAAKEHGYRATFAIRGGWVSSGGRRDVFPRLNVPAGLSPAGLATRLNGFLLEEPRGDD